MEEELKVSQLYPILLISTLKPFVRAENQRVLIVASEHFTCQPPPTLRRLGHCHCHKHSFISVFPLSRRKKREKRVLSRRGYICLYKTESFIYFTIHILIAFVVILHLQKQGKHQHSLFI